MRNLTDDELGAIYTEAFGDRFLPARWENLTGYFRDGVVLFGRALLAKYGTPPDERAILDRERDAYRQAVIDCRAALLETSWCLGSGWLADRDRRYPLPSPEPTPVLTEDELDAMYQRWVSTGMRGKEFAREVEAAVQRKLAQQNPENPPRPPTAMTEKPNADRRRNG